MSNSSSMFTGKRFFPFFSTQALGAFNDNVYKQSLLLLITFYATDMFSYSTDIVVNFAALIFMVPFFIFSATGGELADRYNKAKLIQYIKFVEIFIMSAAAYALLNQMYTLLLLLLFLMGAQSAFFGPVKYAILPNLAKDTELVEANAWVEMGTFVAILGGTIYAGVIVGWDQPEKLVAISIVVISIMGFISSLFIPNQKKPNRVSAFTFNPVTHTLSSLKICFAQKGRYLSIFAISWFWFLGAGYLTQFTNFAKVHLNGDPSVVTLLLCAFTVGVASGSMLCERLSGKRLELGLVPIGSIGLTVFGIDLYFASPSIAPDAVLTASTFFSQTFAVRLFVDLSLIGVFGGFFIVPLYALLQKRSAENERARVIGANNIFNALFMLTNGAFSILVLGYLNVSIPEYFLILSLINVVVALYVYSKLPEFMLRFVVWILTHTFYRVRHKDLDNLPEEGSAIVVCNHVSYVDALILAGACRRPMRFVMYHKIYLNPYLHWFFKHINAIPIAAKQENEAIYHQAFKSIDEALANDEIVCIFPEGKLTKTGQMNTFRNGVETILENRQVPVVPMALKGLWGSFFSHEGEGPFKPGGRIWSKIEVCAGPSIRPENASAQYLQQQVLSLRGETL